MTYRIKDWDPNYENNRTREMKKMQWVPFPNSHDGDGFTQLISERNGTALFGAWVLIVQVASKCNPRGTLLRGNGQPHDFKSLSRMTRGDENIIKESLNVLIEIGWIEEIEGKKPKAGGCGESAGKVRCGDEEGNGIEGIEGIEGNGKYINEIKTIVEFLNEKAGTNFRDKTEATKKIINARLNDGFTVENCKTVIENKCRTWLNTDYAKYLRPQTLFTPSNFESYLNEKRKLTFEEELAEIQRNDPDFQQLQHNT